MPTTLSTEAAPPPVGASRPQQMASWTSSQTHPRTILAKAITKGETTELEVVLDLLEQITHHTAGKKLKKTIEDLIDTLGHRWVCVALAEAGTHKKPGVGLVNRFLTICEQLPDRLMAQEDQRREAWEAAEHKRQEQWEANAPKREAAMEAKRQVREELKAMMGTTETEMAGKAYSRKKEQASLLDWTGLP